MTLVKAICKKCRITQQANQDRKLFEDDTKDWSQGDEEDWGRGFVWCWCSGRIHVLDIHKGIPDNCYESLQQTLMGVPDSTQERNLFTQEPKEQNNENS